MAVTAPSIPYVVNYSDMRLLDFPVISSTNVPMGTPMMPGVTAGTNMGTCIPVTATSNADCIGLLAEPHIFANSGSATTQTLVQWFPVGPFVGNNYSVGVLGASNNSALSYLPSHRLDLIDTFTAVKMDYAIADATAFTVTTATSTTVMTTSTWAASYDSCFVYFTAGTAIGQLGFVKSTIGSTSATLISALTTAFAAGDTTIVILPLFANILPTFLVHSTTVPTKIDTNYATGTVTAANMANFIAQNGLVNRLDPLIHHKQSNLNKLTTLGFFSYLAFYDTIFHPGS